MVQQDQGIEQVLSYLRHQASKPLPELRSLIERTAAQCTRALEGLPEEKAIFRPNPEEWTVLEVLGHLVLALKEVNRLAPRLAAGETSRRQILVGTLGYEGANFGELRKELVQAWQECLAVIDSLPASPDDRATAAHPFFGPLNWREWLAFQRIHALDHVQQIEAIKSDPRYPRA